MYGFSIFDALTDFRGADGKQVTTNLVAAEIGDLKCGRHWIPRAIQGNELYQMA